MSFPTGHDPEGNSRALVIGASHRTCSDLLFRETALEFFPWCFSPRLQSVLQLSFLRAQLPAGVYGPVQALSSAGCTFGKGRPPALGGPRGS